MPLITADAVAAVLHGRRLPGWAPDFPSPGEVDIAGLLARTGVPSGRDAVFGPRLLVERSSGLAVGSAGFHGPPANGRVEIGYGLVQSRHGRGYATEAVRELLRLAFEMPQVLEVAAMVDPANSASIRVLDKTGLTFEAHDGDEDRYVTVGPPPT
jgi:ribosomal-protein-alanine N-acetyltransferase